MASKESLEKNVNHPLRYTKGKVECIDALESAVVGKSPDEAISVANVIKYLWRYEEKEPLRSLMSARWYLDRLIGKYEESFGKYEESCMIAVHRSGPAPTTIGTTGQSVAPDGAVGFGIRIEETDSSGSVKRDGRSTFNGKVLCTSLEDEQHTVVCDGTPVGNPSWTTNGRHG